MQYTEQDISAALDLLAGRRRVRPSEDYHPGRSHDLDGRPVDERDNGQLAFHRSKHVIRHLAPGNGWGKSACLAVEVDWWGHRDHPYQPIPEPTTSKLKLIWCCQKYQQWEMIRGDFEVWWPDPVVASWVGPPHYRYEWPHATLHVVTAETDWTTLQGLQPDLIVGDERFPLRLWREFVKRRRGKTRTRFCLGGTQTEGLTWEYHELYRPWLDFHQSRGMTERDAMRAQVHEWDDPDLRGLPGIFCWPSGSHADNPTATRETWAFYKQTTKGSPAERHVRLYGGFRDFAGDPVFDADALEAMRSQLVAGETGWFS